MQLFNNIYKVDQPSLDASEDHQMVGYYMTGVTEDSRLVVCSPDLPMTVSKLHLAPATPTQYPQVTSLEAASPGNMSTISAPPSGPGAGTAKTKNAVSTTTPGEDPYQCNICSKTFAVPARLTRHYRTHTGEKPFQCEYCAKSFSVKENLSVHRRIHTKERPYKCEVCARAFEHSGKLHRHMRIHTGERPHKCTVCAKTFIQSGQLVIHMRTHTGEKPYVCAVCTKGFTCSKQLKVHSRTHTGEKPYACDICGKSFGYNHVLKLHQVAHYGEKVYKCTICNDTFNSKKCMEAHIKSHSENSASSSASSTSDKENTDTGSVTPVQKYEDRYFTDYLQPSNVVHTQSGVDILAAAAVASGMNDSITTTEDVINLIASHNSRKFVPIGPSSPTQTMTLRHPAYFTVPTVKYEANIEHGNDIRRCVEAALAVASSEEDPLLTPPSSNPVSPAPSSSPEPVEVSPERCAISLPPRKRSKMILLSMASENCVPVRFNSVIQYANKAL